MDFTARDGTYKAGQDTGHTITTTGAMTRRRSSFRGPPGVHAHNKFAPYRHIGRPSTKQRPDSWGTYIKCCLQDMIRFSRTNRVVVLELTAPTSGCRREHAHRCPHPSSFLYIHQVGSTRCHLFPVNKVIDSTKMLSRSAYASVRPNCHERFSTAASEGALFWPAWCTSMLP